MPSNEQKKLFRLLFLTSCINIIFDDPLHIKVLDYGRVENFFFFFAYNEKMSVLMDIGEFPFSENTETFFSIDLVEEITLKLHLNTCAYLKSPTKPSCIIVPCDNLASERILKAYRMKIIKV